MSHAAAGGAGALARAAAAARTLAGVAGAESLNFESALDPGGDFFEGQFQIVAEVRAAALRAPLGGRGGAAEEGFEDIGEAAKGIEGIAGKRAGASLPVEIVMRPPLGIAEDRVGLRDFFEALLGGGIVGVNVGVMLVGKAPKGPFDLVLAGAGINA